MEETNSRHYQDFEITEKGMALRQTVVAGNKKADSIKLNNYKIDFTRGAIGQGRPLPDSDIYYMTELVEHILDVPIKESYAVNNNHIMVIVIDGLNLQEDIIMAEIGIFARILDADTNEEIMSEILYGYTYTNKHDHIPAGSQYNLYREIAFNTVLSRDGKFEVVYDKSLVYITRLEFELYIKDKGFAGLAGYYDSRAQLGATTIQEAIDALACMYPMDCLVRHDLNTYPLVLVLEISGGYGWFGYGEDGYAEGVVKEVKSKAFYKDRNSLRLNILKKTNGVPSILRITHHEFIVQYPDTAFLLLLFESGAAADEDAECEFSGYGN